MPEQIGAQPDRLPHSSTIERVVKQVEVQVWRLPWITGAQPQLSLAQRKVEALAHPYPYWAQVVLPPHRSIGGVVAHENNQVVLERRLRCREAQRNGSRGDLVGVQRIAIASAPGHGNIGMVSQIAPDTRQVLNDRYAEPPQLAGGPNAGQGKDVRRPDCARTEDYLIAIYGELAAIFGYAQAHRSTALKDDAMHETIGLDGQTRTVARRIQIAYRRAHARTPIHVERQRPHTRRIGQVVVLAVSETGVQASPVEGLLLRFPFRGLMPARYYRPGSAMQFVIEVLVRLQLSQVRQHLLVLPFRIAPARPPVEVVRHSAQKLGVVHGAGAAGNFAARDVNVGAVCGSGTEIPHLLALPDGGACAKDIPNGVRHAAPVGIVSARIQKQNGAMRVLRQPCREDRACRTCSHDDMVISLVHFHPVPARTIS